MLNSYISHFLFDSCWNNIVHDMIILRRMIWCYLSINVSLKIDGFSVGDSIILSEIAKIETFL